MKFKTRFQYCWRTASNLLIDYSKHSTVHGVSYLVERGRSCVEQIWWIVAICVSMLGCSKLIYDAWHIYPIIISFTGRPTPIWQIPFPAITICPTIPADSENLRNVVENIPFDGFALGNFPSKEKQQLLALSAICPNTIRLADHINFTHCNGCSKTLHQLAIPAKDIFFECKFKERVINCEDHFQAIGLDRGVCYTFNGIQLFHGNNKIEEPQDWSIDEGYAKSSGISAYPQRATGVGTKFGFSITLTYKKSVLENLCDAGAGFWIEYRMQYEVPCFTTGYITAAMGHSMTVILDPKLMTTATALRDYPITDRKCYYSDELRLTYFSKYTQPNCEAECEIDIVRQRCGCLLFYIEDLADLDTCGPLQEPCVSFYIERIKIINYLGCNCLPACASITFESEVLVNALNITDLKRKHNISGEEYAYTHLSFYFKQNQFMTSQRTELYGRADFLANCGGLLGLFLGVSVISFLEVVYFCSLRLFFNKSSSERNSITSKRLEQPKGLTQVFRALLGDYSSKATLQGINYVANTNLSVVERCWWAITVVMSVFCCGSLISNIYMRLKHSPVIINLATDETSIFDIPFPAITVCPQISKGYTKDMYRYFRNNNGSLYNLDLDKFDSITALAQYCDPDVFGDIDPLNKTSCDKCAQKLLDMIGDFNDVLNECDDPNLTRSCNHIFKTMLTEEGVCFTYNGINVYRQDNGSRWGQTRQDWTLENGYTIDTTRLDLTPQQGSKFPLKVLLSVKEPVVDYLCKDSAQGFKVFLHLPNETPQTSQHYFLLPSNYVTQILVKTKMITTDPEVRELAIDKRQCYFNDERYLMFFRYYTQNNCEAECIANKTIEKCGCLRFHWPRLPDIKYCGISDIQCYQSVIQQSLAQNIGQGQSSDCNCWPGCISISYESELNQFYTSEIEKEMEYPELWENFSSTVFSVGFKESQFVAMKRSQIYGKTEFVANCGGLLGLFLGFSFMSVVEVVYFCTIRLVCDVKKLLH